MPITFQDCKFYESHQRAQSSPDTPQGNAMRIDSLKRLRDLDRIDWDRSIDELRTGMESLRAELLPKRSEPYTPGGLG